MDQDTFYMYLQKSQALGTQSLEELSALLNKYPYFQAAQMLYVKNLQNVEDVRFDDQLKLAAAYVHDRGLLYDFLHHTSQISNEASEELAESKEHSLAEKVTDEEWTLLNSEPEPVSSPAKRKQIRVHKDQEIIGLEKNIEMEKVSPEDLLEFSFEAPDHNEKGKVQTRDQPKVDDNEAQGKASSHQLIDQFIQEQPRIQPPAKNQPSVVDDESLGSLNEEESFMTETLAGIYLKQGYYYKALHSYEQLSLKYPEKSIYFASQIEKIRELINNQ